MDVRDKIIKLSEKNYSIGDIQQISGAKSLRQVKRVLRNNKISRWRKIWDSTLFWRMITLVSVILTIIFFLFPFEVYSVLEFVGLKQSEKAEINLELFTVKNSGGGFTIPTFLYEVNLDKTKLEAFTITAPETNTLDIKDIKFWIKPKSFGEVGIVYVKGVTIPREIHISTENLRYIDYNNMNPVGYTPFVSINPGNIQEEYSMIINKTIIGSEFFVLSIETLKPGDFLTFMMYYSPSPLSADDVVSIDDFYWDVCYSYMNKGKGIDECINNTQSISNKQGRTLDYMIPARIIW